MAKKKAKKRKAAKGKAVIYARFSSDKQREESIEDQVRACRKKAEERGDLVVEVYADHAKSGTTTDGREEFQRMMQDARRGGFETIYVYKLDRFARDRYDAAVNRKALRDCGVEIRPVAESVPDGPEGIILEALLEGMAEYYSANLAQNVLRGMEGNARKCLHNGVKTFGYDWAEDKTYVINEEEAEVVREVFARRLTGEAINSIGADLARRGYVTRSGKQAGFTMANNILKNERYTGVYKWGDVRVEGGMPQIVPEGVFAMAQTIKSRKRRSKEVWDDFVFKGRGICTECGSNLVGVSGRGKMGVKYNYYQCAKKCGCKPIRADWLEEQVAAHLRVMLSDRSCAMAVAVAVSHAVERSKDTDRLGAAKKAKTDAERGMRNLLQAVEQGMDYEDVRPRMEALKLQKARAEADIQVFEDEDVFNVERFADFVQDSTAFDDKTLLDAMVYQVWVDQNRVTVVLNYDQGEEEQDESREPAQLVFPRGFSGINVGAPGVAFEELYAEHGTRLDVAFSRGRILVRFSR